MKIVSSFIIITFIVFGLVFARSNTRIEEKNTQVKNENYWVKGHSDSNDQLDRKRSHKRRRKIRKPVKGLR